MGVLVLNISILVETGEGRAFGRVPVYPPAAQILRRRPEV
jgi:hypothetical protein